MAKEDIAIPETSIGGGITYGAIRFVPPVEPKPATSTTKGNVTINNAAIEGRPASFTASFSITVSHKLDGCRTNTSLVLDIPVLAIATSDPYSEVEDAAAEKIAPILREIANQIEAEVERINSENAEFERSHKSETTGAE